MVVEPAAITRLDWADIALRLDRDGYALLPGMLPPQSVQALRRLLGEPGGMRGAAAAAAGGKLGRAEFFYFNEAEALAPPPIAWRAVLYRHLAPIANRWNELLGDPYRYPMALQDFLKRNREAGRTCVSSCLIRMVQHDCLALHRRNGGEHVGPRQLVGLLSEPGGEFSGGEFIMTEQRPRMQSRPMVLPLQCGDAALIATAQRPVKGSKAYYRVTLKHAVGRILSGERIGLELCFHDAMAPDGARSPAQSSLR